MITPQKLREAVQQHGIFIDVDLNKVEPKPGQWFCEAYVEQDRVQYETLVEYVGQSEVWLGSDATELRHEVSEEASDDARRPQGDALILQGRA
jgi:hypothetical protein